MVEQLSSNRHPGLNTDRHPAKGAAAPLSSHGAPPRVVAGDDLYRRHLLPTQPDNLLESALNEYFCSLEEMPDSAAIHARIAQVFLQQGHYAKAEQHAQKAVVLQQNPASSDTVGLSAAYDGHEAYSVLGQLAMRLGRYQQAVSFFQQAVRISGWQGSSMRWTLFKAYATLFRDNIHTLNGWMQLLPAGYSLLSSCCLLPFAKDRLPLELAFGLFPALILAWMEEESGARPQALKRYRQLQRQFPGVPGLALVIGEFYREKGELDEARLWFEQVIARHPAHLNAYYHLGKLLEEREEYAEMATVYETLIRLKPNDADLHCNLANAYYYAQNYAAALCHYEIALKLGRDSRWKSLVAQSIGNIQNDYLGNGPAAMAYYQMAVVLDPAEVEHYIQLGLLYFSAEDYTNAEVVYRQALAIAPRHARLHSNLGYLRWLAHDVKGAIAAYEQAMALEPDYEIPVNNLGVIYLDMLGQVEAAIALFQQAIVLEPEYALAHYNLGRAHSFLGNCLEAAQAFQAAQCFDALNQELDHQELTERINQLFDTP